MKISTFLKKNMNTLLIIAILVLVVLMFKKTMREGFPRIMQKEEKKKRRRKKFTRTCVKEGLPDSEYSNERICGVLLRSLSSNSNRGASEYEARMYNRFDGKIYRKPLKDGKVDPNATWAECKDDQPLPGCITKQMKLKNMNCCDSKPTNNGVTSMQAAQYALLGASENKQEASE